MAFDWTAYLGLAQTLAIPMQPPDEARLRAAISRAYYAAFHVAHAYRERKNGPLPRSDNPHQAAISFLIQQPVTQKLGETLNRLRRNRNHADYDDVIISDLTKMTQVAIKSAQSIIAGLASSP